MSNSKMTVGQGLRRIKKLKGLLSEAQQRASSSTTWADDKKPVFDFAEQRKLRADHQAEIVRIETAIARANASTQIDVGERKLYLAHAIREMQELKGDLAWIASLNLRQGVETTTEYVYDEVKERNLPQTKSVTHTAVMSEPERVKEVQNLRDKLEALNDAVETANHRTLIEVEQPPQADAPEAAA
ncbi:hypothetical protein IT407_00490 [Candidatus Uhrbacteria bacterium]|nr:hypothetical protein [Candidatus Uhrbacteria bacterium]